MGKNKMGKNKLVTIIGGSGFVGRAIMRQAIAAGYCVRIVCRHPQRAAALRVDGATIHQANVVTGRGIEDALRDSTVVINLVGLLFERGCNTFQATHVDGTARIIAACTKLGIKRYLHMSALGADLASQSGYARSKAEAELIVKKSDLNWTIFRPSVIYGANDNFLCRFAALASWLPLFPVIAAQSALQPVWIEDVARAFVSSIALRASNKQSVVLAGPKSYSVITLIKMTMEQLGRRRKLLPISPPMDRLMAKAMQLLPHPILTLDQLTLLQQDNVTQEDPFPSWLAPPTPLTKQMPIILGGNDPVQMQRHLDKARYDVSMQME